jgi:hypothetical protein
LRDAKSLERASSTLLIEHYADDDVHSNIMCQEKKFCFHVSLLKVYNKIAGIFTHQKHVRGKFKKVLKNSIDLLDNWRQYKKITSFLIANVLKG